MLSDCPVCFQPLQEATCPHCGTDLRPIRVTRALETIADGRDTYSSLQEVLAAYRRMERPQAAGRVMGKLADYCLRNSLWREAQHYFEQILALGESAGSPSFRAAAKRQLGALLGRMGELPLGLHLLGQAEAAGDSFALVERLRLETEAASKSEALLLVTQLEKSPQRTREAEAWRMESLARFDMLPQEHQIEALIKTAEESGDAVTEAILRRAWAIWQMNHQQAAEARVNLQRAIDLFHEQHLPYERARTQVDLSRAYLLEEVNNLSIVAHMSNSEASVLAAQHLLGKAIATFRTLGTPVMDAAATELLNSLSIGRVPPPPSGDSTSTSVALIWLSLDGTWADELWQIALDTIHHQRGVGEKMLGGIVGFFGAEQHRGDLSLIAETALALNDLMIHFRAHHKDKVDTKSSFRIVAAMGMLPQADQDNLGTVRRLTGWRLFQEARALASELAAGAVAVNDILYLATRERYTYTALESSSRTATPSPEAKAAAPETPDPVRHEDAKDPRWWLLSLPTKAPPSPPATKRYRLQGYSSIFERIDTLLDKFKTHKEGGLVILSGLPGTGKTRLLELFSHEIQNSTHSWLIHLRGREARSDQPFSAIQHWLGGDIHATPQAPRERRLSYVATFRRSVVGLLGSKPLLMLVDDVHLLDSGSLATLKAVLPLTASHHLMIIMTARPQQASSEWETMLEAARRALPDRSLHVRLPDALAYQARPLPDDLMTRHVLACAAVLGDHFSTSALRRAANALHLERHLKKLEADGFVQPADKIQNWKFKQTAERDSLYNSLNPDYRAVLHWHVRQALKKLGLPSDDHVHPAGIAEPALKISIRNAQKALEMDCPAEALLHFDRALGHYQGERAAVELLLGRAAVLLTLGDLPAAQEALNKVQEASGLSPQEEANRLILQGELNFRVGEVATLFKLYEQAAEKLRQQPADQISVLYAQALARFKRGEVEMARSLTGGALLMAQQAGIENEMAHLWELLANIHHARGEVTEAQRAIEKAILNHKASRQQWQLMEPLEKLGQLALASGNLETARKQLQEALDLAEAIGDAESIIRLHQELGLIATYRGEFGKLNGHLEAALKVALFAENAGSLVKTRAALAEGLGLEGKQVEALQQATLALQQAEQDGGALLLAAAQLSLARVALTFNCLDDAERAAEKAQSNLALNGDGLLRLKLDLIRMELALARGNASEFQKVWGAVRSLQLEKDDLFLRARMGLVVGRHYAAQKEWNNAAREVERAVKTFARLGAVYWYGKGRAQLREIAPNAPGYHEQSRHHLRGKQTGPLSAKNVPNEKAMPSDQSTPDSKKPAAG